MRPDHSMWLYLRRVPIEQLLMRPQLIPKKHFTNKAIATQLERAIKVASGRCGGLDIDVDHDAHKFVACIMWVILGRHRSAAAPSQARAAWTEVVKERVDRLYRGEFAALFNEAAAAAEMAGPRGGQVDQVRRAVELAHLGKVSKSFGALTSGGVLPLEEAAVREAFSTFLQPNNESPIAGWRDFVTQSGGADPGSAVYKFELGECEVIGANGQIRTVDTLEHALHQCDTTAAAGFLASVSTSSNAWILLQFGHCFVSGSVRGVGIMPGAWMDARRASPIMRSCMHFWYRIEELPWTRTALGLHPVVQ